MAAEEKEPPTAVKCEYTSSLTNTLTLTMNDSAWLAAVATKRATLTINELTYTYRDDFGMFCSDPYWHVKGNNIEFVVTTPSSFFPAVFTLSADGYKDVKITVSKTGNWPNESVSATVEIVDGSGSTEQPDTPDTPVSPGTPDNPVSPDSPDNPVSPENPDNPVSPSNPDKPVLPQTGQLNWPVPVLACSGVLLFAAGWVLNRQGKKEN